MARLAAGIALALVLSGCSLFGGCPEALLQGELIADGHGGLAVQSETGPMPVRWPDGYRTDGAGTLVLRDAHGDAVASEGDTIYVGGGMNVANDQFEACGYVSRDPPWATPRP